MKENVAQIFSEFEESCIELRRYFHQNPEISGEEYKTSDYIKNFVQSLGLEIKQVSNTGFIAILNTGKRGRVIALRTELDALPVKEDNYNLKEERAVISKFEGKMHACGHDAHMAILLTAMRILSRLKSELNGKIVFVFEEGEEEALGINKMIIELKKLNVDAIYGNHVFSNLQSGKICVDSGPIMAGALPIQFTIHGKGGHASRPDQTSNPLIAGVSVINELMTTWNNVRDISKTVTLGIAKFQSGEQGNVISDEASIGGTMRFFDIDAGREAAKLVKNLTKTICKLYDCSVEFGSEMDHLYPPNVNDNELSDLAKEILLDMEDEVLIEDVKWYASETFAKYSVVCPTLFSLVGINNPKIGSGAIHHSSKFDIDETALGNAVKLMVLFTVNFLK